MRRRRPVAGAGSQVPGTRITAPTLVEDQDRRQPQYHSWSLTPGAWLLNSRKEVIQPQVPLRLPCYDFTPVADLTVVGYFPCGLARRLRVKPTPMV
jgi:hypothetical protein